MTTVRPLRLVRPHDPEPLHAHESNGPHFHGTLALEWIVGDDLPAVPEAPTRLRLVTDAPAEDDSPVLPDAQWWSGRLAQGIVDVIEGRRPASQLARWTAPDVHGRITRIARAAAESRVVGNHAPTRSTGGSQRRPAPGRVTCVRVYQPTPGSAEVAVVFTSGRRVRALALRLEEFRGRWRASALEIA